jgi:hypothetical protein
VFSLFDTETIDVRYRDKSYGKDCSTISPSIDLKAGRRSRCRNHSRRRESTT